MGANLTPTKTLLFINSAICEDTMKTVKSSCVFCLFVCLHFGQKPLICNSMACLPPGSLLLFLLHFLGVCFAQEKIHTDQTIFSRQFRLLQSVNFILTYFSLQNLIQSNQDFMAIVPYLLLQETLRAKYEKNWHKDAHKNIFRTVCLLLKNIIYFHEKFCHTVYCENIHPVMATPIIKLLQQKDQYIT